jgi:hypothetical protein
MSENWHEERHRILALLTDLESGNITHFDEDERGKLRGETTGVTVERLNRRLAELDSRLGPREEA